MGKKGTSKARSVDQESYVALHYGGIRSRSSGAALRDVADVETDTLAIECKTTGGPGEDPITKPRIIRLLEELAFQSYQAGKDPLLAMRYYLPESPLANPEGWVDVSIRPLCDDS